MYIYMERALLLKKRCKSINAFCGGTEMILNAKSGIFLLPPVKGTKIWTYRQILQRLPVALAHMKTGNTLEHLLIEIREIIYSL